MLSKSSRSNIAKLRSGTLPLNIELGRYTNVPKEQRTCKMCNYNVIEDELHFMFKCPKYLTLRLILFQKVYTKTLVDFSTMSDMEHIQFFTTDKRIIGDTSAYIRNALLLKN